MTRLFADINLPASPLLLVLGLLGLILVVLVLWVLVSYYRHKAPLKAIDPDVRYSLFHHIGIVIIPTLRYRLQNKLRRTRKDPVG